MTITPWITGLMVLLCHSNEYWSEELAPRGLIFVFSVPPGYISDIKQILDNQWTLLSHGTLIVTKYDICRNVWPPELNQNHHGQCTSLGLKHKMQGFVRAYGTDIDPNILLRVSVTRLWLITSSACAGGNSSVWLLLFTRIGSEGGNPRKHNQA